VDESRSLTTADVMEERSAAELIVNSADLDPASEIAVVGFGSSDAPGQTAAVERCPLAPLDNPADFKPCIAKLHQREDDEGSGTDHTAAMRRALEILSMPGEKDLVKLVFFLTDGGLLVGNSPQYGQTEAARNAEAERQLVQEVLPEAKAAGVQIWPLGFGRGIDMGGLQTLAEGGAGANRDCGPTGAALAPAVLIAQTADKIGSTLLSAFEGTCMRAEKGNQSVLPSGGTAVMSVQVHLTASNASINVQKRHQGVQVAYLDPQGRDVTKLPGLEGSLFKLTGVGGTTESMRVSNPIPGAWTVRFASPPAVPDQVVTATLLWKGQLRSDKLAIEPDAPTAGRPLIVRTRFLTPRYVPIADPAVLADLGVQTNALVRGDGFDPLRVNMADDGVEPDIKAGDGEYAGRAVLPLSASGGVSVENSVTALGFAPNTGRPVSAKVMAAQPVQYDTKKPQDPWYQKYWYLLPVAEVITLFGLVLFLVRRRTRRIYRTEEDASDRPTARWGENQEHRSGGGVALREESRDDLRRWRRPER
jgi:hypothetical protein